MAMMSPPYTGFQAHQIARSSINSSMSNGFVHQLQPHIGSSSLHMQPVQAGFLNTMAAASGRGSGGLGGSTTPRGGVNGVHAASSAGRVEGVSDGDDDGLLEGVCTALSMHAIGAGVLTAVPVEACLGCGDTAAVSLQVRYESHCYFCCVSLYLLCVSCVSCMSYLACRAFTVLLLQFWRFFIGCCCYSDPQVVRIRVY